MEMSEKKKQPYAGRSGIIRRFFETTSIKGVPKVRGLFWKAKSAAFVF